MTSTQTVRWNFTSAVAGDRAARLPSWPTFDAIVEQLSDCAVAPLYWEPASSVRLSGCHRASFTLTVEPDVYDAFFNSPAGYRGEFAKSEYAGESANRKLLDTLFPRLLQAADSHAKAQPALVAASLQGKQAKIWIDETEVDDQLSDPQSHIIFAPWEFNEPDGPGLRAPVGTKLEVKGAWVGPTGVEVVNEAKARRSSHINRSGDSK